MTIEDENQESENEDDNQEPDEDELIDQEIAALISEVERLTAENAAIISRVGECESAIAGLREHKHEPEPKPEPEPEPERLPEPEPIPEERHLWYRHIGRSA